MTTKRNPSKKRRPGIFVFIVRHRTLRADVDRARLTSLRFTNPTTASRAEAVLRSLTVGARVILGEGEGGYWVAADALDALLTHIIPGLAVWFDAELDLPEASLHVEGPGGTVCGADLTDGRAHQVSGGVPVALHELKWVSPSRNIADCTEYLEWAVTTLVQRCSVIIAEGDSTRPENLFFEVGPDFEREVLGICADLGALFVCVRDPVETNSVVPPGTYPFARLLRGRFPTKVGAINGWKLSLGASESYFNEMLAALRPGIAGWDVDISTLPPRAGAEVSPWPSSAGALSLSEQIWRAGESPLAEAVTSYLQTVGVALAWKPYGLRFIARSPLAEDNEAPLLLARLYTAAGEQVGVQRIRLDTRQRKLLLASAVDSAVCIKLWRPKPRVLLTTVLEDALALNKLTRSPVVVIPVRAHLARYGLEDGVDRYDVCLPSEAGADWLEAARAFRGRASEQGVEVHIYRLRRQADHEGEYFWWKALLDAHAAGVDGHAQFERHRLPEFGAPAQPAPPVAVRD